ncbi:MAG TPA: DUF72 domain-containing protein [Solirubrobacterales bacterium]|nr:DUF72 domain-containing protein [Solirubrobacterales bacterium]
MSGKPVDNVFYGTSSWTDPTLVKSKAFYPADAGNPEKRLRFYAEHFPLVEVDASFYALPSERNARLWAERTPAHFVFNVKAFGLMTQHAVNTKSLPEPIRDMLPAETASKARVYPRDLPRDALDAVWDMFAGALQPLADAGKLGAILYQFPQWFAASRDNVAYLRELAERSPAQPAIEFRGAGWMKEGKQERTLGLLREIGATYVVVDEPQGFKTSVPPVVAATSPDLAMIRFHGHNAENWEKRGISAAERFKYLYDEDELRKWVAPARELAGEAQQLHVLMNNCYADYGVRNAAQFAELLAED